MKLFLVKKIIAVLFFLPSLYLNAQVQITANGLKLGFNSKGFLTEIGNSASGKNYLYTDSLSPLLTLISKGEKYSPTSLTRYNTGNTIKLKFGQVNVTVEIKLVNKNTHLVLEIINAIPENKIDAIIWGPFSTTIKKTIGEVIGVARDSEIALGMLVLNIKTLGGDLPNNEGSTWARGIAAKEYVWGSSLQAYTINRNRNRMVDAWGGQFKNMPVVALKGETVVGSKIAFFLCPESKALETIEAITIAEKLPYPTVNKTWFKKSPLFGKSYLISSFGEKDVDEMIGYTKKAGLFSLYHEGPFKSWGHYILNPEDFPNGNKGLKNCVDKAHAAGLHFGVHTLTNFINTNDPYITPVPDDRLSMTGSSTLTKDIDKFQKEIAIASPEYFNLEKNNNLHTVKVGKELIRYKSVTTQNPYQLLDCQRGAFGTTISAHKKGEVVGKLFDHAYEVFFPNLAMQREIARNIANLFNETGVDHFDLDGHEGCLASGEGDYALELFAKDVFDNMKHELIFGTSTSKTYFWNICSYYNWGEPWYGGFNESMQQYRIDNQGLFDRNYMPHMMGWYLLGENTTLNEMEWMLARAAGYNAGFAMVARPGALRNNPLTAVLLDAIKEWETARTSNAFTNTQQEELKNTKNEFHLEKISEGKWNLFQYRITENFVREKFIRQPGEPTHTTWNFNQPWKEQVLQFRIYISGKEGSVNNIKLAIDNYTEINLKVELEAGESIVCDGTETIKIYTKKGKLKGDYKLSTILPKLAPGSHTITSNCFFRGDEPPKIEVQFKGLMKTELVQSILR